MTSSAAISNTQKPLFQTLTTPGPALDSWWKKMHFLETSHGISGFRCAGQQRLCRLCWQNLGLLANLSETNK